MTDKHPGGRPTLYNEKLANEICEKIANSVFGLNHLCKENPHWPHRITILRWVAQNGQFCNMYDKAKEDQADFSAEEVVTVAYDDKKDHKAIIDDKGNEKTVVVSEAVNRSRLKVDALKYRAAILNRRKYGDKNIEDLKEDNNKYKEELRTLRLELDAKNKKEY